MGINRVKALVYCNIIILIILYVSCIKVNAQLPTRYLVEFTDKNNSPYSITQPSAFLSPRAIERRSRQHIDIKINDLPVNPSYVAGVSATGAQILARSKWLNAVVIHVSDTAILSQINALSYVKEVSYVAMKKKEKNDSLPRFNKWDEFYQLNDPAKSRVVITHQRPKNTEVFDYGPSANQIAMIKGDKLHEVGFRGQGMVIALLDAGFYRADIVPCFDSLRQEGRLLGTKDFANPGGNVFNESSHGMNVLSTMAGLVPGEIIGTAPKASYWLLRSEDQNSESPVEEDCWVAAAEFADSVGADVINSSLGYTVFDDPSLNHTQAEMDGNTTHCTIGADIAASKGILVVCSAGNSGGSFWQIISAPADGDSVLTVGAVDASGFYAPFSSTGPTADGRVKPDVATQGAGTILYSSSGGVFSGNGTSFSSPVMAGAAACLWQAHPGATNMEILHAIQKSANRFSNPDIFTGYGIPDLSIADKNLYVTPSVTPLSGLNLYPNPSRDNLSVKVFFNDYQDITLEVFDNTGRRILPVYTTLGHPGENIIKLNDTESLPAGIYLIKMKAGSNILVAKWLKM